MVNLVDEIFSDRLLVLIKNSSFLIVISALDVISSVLKSEKSNLILKDDFYKQLPELLKSPRIDIVTNVLTCLIIILNINNNEYHKQLYPEITNQIINLCKKSKATTQILMAKYFNSVSKIFEQDIFADKDLLSKYIELLPHVNNEQSKTIMTFITTISQVFFKYIFRMINA